ncbi:DNA topoisomerase 4 subunit A [Waddlia chondrophila 2032/99]|uniref:DNA topoisomerase IV, subunit A n=3 Tax=Waddlia chondrophila TaxID=71667 RepID=D6YS64_WADCW|nr:DNA topoisomerase IV subunit A [Waddlia chondrophila]ADI38909.1 DNA topoisomerase IV, subunit A [Waddlia chondrophila WSU 86-1044]CCB90423.1 DNA topoisomerase 4 subunit A [Waddlia chondrophila 2032/99]
MDDIKYLYKDNYIKYASYVILDRAIPDVVDGLKPVQRRILHTLYKIHDGKLHKVANVAGQTMAYHPHGDAAIIDALVNMANKGFFLDCQGNFGNIYTGDPAAAARYIETRLSPLAKDTLFNPDLTETVSSYDGRNQEPVCLPAKVPVVLMQGASGIAVGMSTNILPHNFIELLQAEIAVLEGKDFEIYPDFITGGIMDVSEYDKGRGRLKLRAKIDIQDPKTLVISEICHGTTTESLIRSIDEAAKRGKIKIDSINDYTADKVEIEIKLPRGHYAQDLIDSLYAYTDCEVSINCMCMVIKDHLPWETTVDEILRLHAELLKGYLKKELELEKDRLLEKIFDKTLEQIFIENRLYKHLETVKSSDKLRSTVADSLKPFHEQLSRVPTKDDIEKLLQIPIRRISKFDMDKNQEEIAGLRKELARVEKDLKSIKQFTIKYLKELVSKYRDIYTRRTRVGEIQELDKRAIATKELKVGIDLKSGFVGTKVSGSETIEGTNFDKLLVLYQDGSYRVTNIPEKDYVHASNNKAVFVGLADKQTVFNVAYKDPKSHLCFAKRFIIKQFILDKEYRFFEEGMGLAYLSTEKEPILEVQLIPKIKQKISKVSFPFSDVLIKGVSARGVRVSSRGVKKIKAAK